MATRNARVVLKRSVVATTVPLVGNLLEGELAINIADRKLYTRHGEDVVRVGVAPEEVTTGAPQTLTSTTPNENDEAGHTHAINAVDVVTAGIAAMTSGGIGSYALLRHNQVAGSLSPGTARAGSNLQWANAGGAGSPGSPSGTWRCEGNIDNTNDATGANRTTLFRRIL